MNQTVTAADVPLTLKSVSVSPSQTQAELCYGGSAFAMRGWAPNFQLDTGKPVDMSQSGSGSAPIEGTTCRRIELNLPLAERKGTWTLTVSEIVGFAQDEHTPERLAGPWIFKFEMK